MMDITRNDLFIGSLIGSITHAVMTNVYPDLSYEQSWESNHYSIQNSQGLRGTISFEQEYCVGAIRNEKSELIDDSSLKKILANFPQFVIKTAKTDTLQYLLLTDKNGNVSPAITSIFWADNARVHYGFNNFSALQVDFHLFAPHLLSEDKALEWWKKFYDMDDEAIKLVRFLLAKKKEDFLGPIFLNQEQQRMIPGDYLLDECAESLGELNIFFSHC